MNKIAASMILDIIAENTPEINHILFSFKNYYH